MPHAKMNKYQRSLEVMVKKGLNNLERWGGQSDAPQEGRIDQRPRSMLRPMLAPFTAT